MTTPTDPIAALRALAEKATPGPWTSSREDIDSYTESENKSLDSVAYVYRDPEHRIPVFGDNFRHDARLIVAMRNALPGLLERLERAEALIRACRLVQDLDVSRYPLCNSDLAGINEAFMAYDTAAEAPQGAGE